MCFMEVCRAVESTRSWSIFTGINEYGYIDIYQWIESDLTVNYYLITWVKVIFVYYRRYQLRSVSLASETNVKL